MAADEFFLSCEEPESGFCWGGSCRAVVCSFHNPHLGLCSGSYLTTAPATKHRPMQEYGSGRLSRKHSTFFAAMMRELGLVTQNEAYLDLVPWQVG